MSQENLTVITVGKNSQGEHSNGGVADTGMVNLGFESDDHQKGSVNENGPNNITDLDDNVNEDAPNGIEEDRSNGRIENLNDVNGNVSNSNGNGTVVIDVDSPEMDINRRNGSLGPDGMNDIRYYEWITAQFKKIAGEKGHITLKDFKDALQIKKSFFAERFFAIFDENGSGSIELLELMTGLRMLTRGSPTEKLRFLFRVYDIDGSGYIDRDELNTVLRTSMEESSLTLGEDKLTQMTDAIFEAADTDNSGELSFDELKSELEKYPGVMENLTISAASWLKVPRDPVKKKPVQINRHFTSTYIRNNLKKIIFLILYLLLNIALGAYAANNYRTFNGWYILARICGMNLNFNGMFILVLMLRKSLTYIRLTFLHHILPIDQNIYFHKLVGVFISVYTVFHTVGHIGNAFIVAAADDNVVNATSDLQTWEILFTTKAGIGFVGASAFITGWILDVVLLIMVICSMSFVRRSGHFEVFYWTHTLYVAFWILLILHGPNFWKWFIAPGIIFIGEKFFRSRFVKRVRYGSNYIQEVTLLPSGVTHLVISKGEKFRYKPGDYVFIQIPRIANYEWHPFTISSAPEMPGTFSLHIRSAGHWTKKLYEYFEELDPGAGNTFEEEDDVVNRRRTTKRSMYQSIKGTFQKSTRSTKSDTESREAVQAERRKRRKHKRVRIRCHIDGPYGTGCREVFDTEHAILIGAGIGVTPMASILQSVMYRFKASKRKCPNCSHEFYGEISEHSMNLKKVDFIWINRDQKCFEWFMSMLTELELEQAEIDKSGSGKLNRIIDMQFFMTSVKDLTDMKGIGLQLAMDLLHKKDNKDLITGLRTRTQAGRPKWNKVLTEIAAQKKGKVKVFFCGAPALGKLIKVECEKFGFAFSKENF